MSMDHERLNWSVHDLWPYLNQAEWRLVGMLTEEAGEVQGAFNKMSDGRDGWTQKQIITELIQLTACCYILANFHDMDSYDLQEAVIDFLGRKHEQLSKRGVTHGNHQA